MNSLKHLQLFKSFRRKPTKITLLGLENSGKTSIYHYLQHGQAPLVQPEPTLSFNKEKIEVLNKRGNGSGSVSSSGSSSTSSSSSSKNSNSKNNPTKLTFNLWDVSGSQISIDYFWRSHIEGCGAIIFVIDSTDREKFSLVREELIKIISYKESAHLPILLLVNKIDAGMGQSGHFNKPATSKEIVKILNLQEICKTRMICVQQTSTKTGYGLQNIWLKIHKMILQSKEFKYDDPSEQHPLASSSGRNIFRVSNGSHGQGNGNSKGLKLDSVSFNSPKKETEEKLIQEGNFRNFPAPPLLINSNLPPRAPPVLPQKQRINVNYVQQQQTIYEIPKIPSVPSVSSTVPSVPSPPSTTSPGNSFSSDHISLDSGNCSNSNTTQSQSTQQSVVEGDYANPVSFLKMPPPKPPIRRTKSCRYSSRPVGLQRNGSFRANR